MVSFLQLIQNPNETTNNLVYQSPDWINIENSTAFYNGDVFCEIFDDNDFFLISLVWDVLGDVFTCRHVQI